MEPGTKQLLNSRYLGIEFEGVEDVVVESAHLVDGGQSHDAVV